MGVSGCGKTTTGKLLAEKLDLPFYDADDFHPQKNVDKMKSGLPLTDRDRVPWLEKLATHINKWSASGGAVLACSALKESYRTVLKPKHESDVHFVYLKGSEELIYQRLKSRKGHYMPAELLRSQFSTLEEPKNTCMVSIEKTPENIVEEIIKFLKKSNH